MLQAFKNDPALKQRTLQQLKSHYENEQIVQAPAHYWNAESFTGCSIGCVTHDKYGGHDQYPDRLGLPRDLAFIKECIFEGLAPRYAPNWPLLFMSVIKPGVNLTPTTWEFLTWVIDGVPMTRHYTKYKVKVLAELRWRAAGHEADIDQLHKLAMKLAVARNRVSGVYALWCAVKALIGPCIGDTEPGYAGYAVYHSVIAMRGLPEHREDLFKDYRDELIRRLQRACD